jgi:hypothetical protein
MWKSTPALVIAVLALSVALAYAADAVVSAAVPLARRALVAENANKLNGQTAREIAKTPGPASTAIGIITTRSKTIQFAGGAVELWTVECSTDEKVISGGFSSDVAVVNLVVSHAVNERTWQWGFANLGSKSGTIRLDAICIR